MVRNWRPSRRSVGARHASPACVQPARPGINSDGVAEHVTSRSRMRCSSGSRKRNTASCRLGRARPCGQCAVAHHSLGVAGRSRRGDGRLVALARLQQQFDVAVELVGPAAERAHLPEVGLRAHHRLSFRLVIEPVSKLAFPILRSSVSVNAATHSRCVHICAFPGEFAEDLHYATRMPNSQRNDKTVNVLPQLFVPLDQRGVIAITGRTQATHTRSVSGRRACDARPRCAGIAPSLVSASNHPRR